MNHNPKPFIRRDLFPIEGLFLTFFCRLILREETKYSSRSRRRVVGVAVEFPFNIFEFFLPNSGAEESVVKRRSSSG